MRKLIKKSLAFCLVAMLVLSAFVGTFAVSAESVAEVAAETVTVDAGTTEVTVPVTITVTDGFYAAFIQVQSEFGALTAVSIPDDADYNVTADDYTAVDLATGKMLVMSIYGDDLRNDLTTATVNCTFTADAAPAAGDYAVTVTLPEVPAADWAEYAVALTAANGKVVVTGTTVSVSDYISDVTLTYSAEAQQVTGAIAYTKADAKELAEAVQSLDGVITYLGIAMTTDGTDPATSATAFVQGNDVNSNIWNKLLAGNQVYNASAYYYGMNFKQIEDTDVRFVAVVKYTVSDETVTVYGAENSGNLYEYLSSQTDDASLALLDAIALNKAATSVDTITAELELTEEFGPTFTASYDLATVKSTGKISYTKAQGKALADYVVEQGGNSITYLGIAMTTDGTDPTTSATAFVQGNDVNSNIWNKLLAGNQAYNASAYYLGMNVAQFGSELKFAAVVKVATDDGEYSFYSDVQTIRFIDQIAADNSELANAYEALYTSFVG